MNDSQIIGLLWEILQELKGIKESFHSFTQQASEKWKPAPETNLEDSHSGTEFSGQEWELAEKLWKEISPGVIEVISKTFESEGVIPRYAWLKVIEGDGLDVEISAGGVLPDDLTDLLVFDVLRPRNG